MKKTIKDIDVSGKKVIVRCDFNVPLDNGEITDNSRITATIPTIDYLIEKGAKVILISHLGRPKGTPSSKFSLLPVKYELSSILGQEVLFIPAPQVITDGVIDQIDNMQPGQVMLLENIRFRKEEEEYSPGFAKELAALGDIFVNDAFGAAHRAHSSTVGIAEYLPAVSGLLMERELKYLGEVLDDPKRPFVAILGGSKVSDKITVINNLMKKADVLLIGGGMAFTFIKANGNDIGTSIVDDHSLDLALEIEANAKELGVEFILPVDVVTAWEFDNDTKREIHDIEIMPHHMMGLDIGPKTVKLFEEKIKNAGTVLWNGPMGVFEMPNFAAGTRGVGEAMAESDATTIVSGGDSVAAVKEFGLTDRMTYVSTGGGASLELIEGRILPGIAALEDK